jgi:adenosylcobinamide-phosphate synthase
VIAGDHLWILALALVLDAIVGDPDWLWRRLPHPVVAIGRLVGALDRAWNREDLPSGCRKAAGIVALLVVVAVTAAIGLIIEKLFSSVFYGWILTIVVVAVVLAGRSLYNHVAAVAAAYEREGVGAARRAVARIVGRDPENLDEAGIIRAAIESAAENFSDGLVAPAFWFALLGLPGLLAYKAINTADSMIGHRSPRHRDFGWASARLDDLANWLPARLSAAAIALAAPVSGGTIGAAFQVLREDGKKHRSPNAGWPEAAMAGALGVSLSGPRSYGGVLGEEPYLNGGGSVPTADDIRRALRVYAGAWALVFVVACVVSLLFL